ncbi:MAG: hypothetical protein WCP45_05295 [Verrucomicrobiota bacterium]
MKRPKKIRKLVDSFAHNPAERQADHKTRKILKLLDSIKVGSANHNRETNAR